MSSRRGPMHTCCVSLITIAVRTYRNMQDFNMGPIGSVTKKMVKFVSPLLCFLHCHLLSILSSLDDRILAVENVVESVFPPSKHVFDKIDELVQVAESLPVKFDDALCRFPVIIHQVPLLNWALVHSITWLNFLISVLVYWGSGSEKEKEIVVDTNCDENTNGSAAIQDSCNGTESECHDRNDIKEDFDSRGGDETDIVSPNFTYKDALEKGTKDDLENKEDSIKEEIQISSVCREENEQEIENPDSDRETGRGGTENDNSKQNGDCAEEENMDTCKMEESTSKEDPIMELFESAWLMTARKTSKGSSIQL